MTDLFDILKTKVVTHDDGQTEWYFKGYRFRRIGPASEFDK